MPKRSLSVASDDPRNVECEDCGATVMRSNISRHRMTHLAGMKRHLRSTSVSSLPTNRVMDINSHQLTHNNGGSVTSQPSNPMLFHPSRECRTPDVSFSNYLMASAAASAAVEQHDRYNLRGLCAYVGENFPTIPVDARPYLVIGAAACAQYAAQIHFLADTHEASVEPDKQLIAARARCSLSSWAIGLRRDDSLFHSDGSITSANDMLLPSTIEAVPEFTACQADTMVPSADLQVSQRSNPLLDDPTLADVICPVSQAESNVAFEDAVAAFAQQLGEIEVTQAAQLFGDVGSATSGMDDESTNHYSPDSGKSSTIYVPSLPPPVNGDLTVSLEIDLTAPSDVDVDTVVGNTGGVSTGQMIGGKASTSFIINEPTTSENERDTVHQSQTTAPVTQLSLSAKSTTLTSARATAEELIVIKPPAEKTTAGRSMAINENVVRTPSSREAASTLKTAPAGRTDVKVPPRSSQRDQPASVPTSTKKPGESRPLVALQRADGRRSPVSRPRERNDRTTARRAERDDRRTSLARPSVTSRSRSRSPIRRPSDVGGTYVSRTDYEDFVRWKKTAKK